jgi:hypothetical protein
MGPGLASLTPKPGVRPGAANREMVHQVRHEYIETMAKADAIIADLLNSPVLKVIYDLLMGRIKDFLHEDAASQELIRVLGQLRQGIEWGPKIAESKVKQLMGGPLGNIFEEQEKAEQKAAKKATAKK